MARPLNHICHQKSNSSRELKSLFHVSLVLSLASWSRSSCPYTGYTSPLLFKIYNSTDSTELSMEHPSAILVANASDQLLLMIPNIPYLNSY
jgi:hypothetical protein